MAQRFQNDFLLSDKGIDDKPGSLIAFIDDDNRYIFLFLRVRIFWHVKDVFQKNKRGYIASKIDHTLAMSKHHLLFWQKNCFHDGRKRNPIEIGRASCRERA